MMDPLHQAVEKASRSRLAWSLDDVSVVIKELCEKIPSSSPDWEIGTEMWARVLTQKVSVAMIHSLMPLLLIETKYLPLINRETLPENLTIFAHDRFDQQDFSIPQEELEILFNKQFSRYLDYESLSIDDLWWATVY